MALYTDFRPKDFSEVVGNTTTVRTLKAIFDKGQKFPHAIMLYGPSGTGKTTLGRIIKDKLGCSYLDYKEVNAASKDSRGIDGMTEIIDSVKYKPLMGKVKVWLIDEAHQISSAGMNSMLKILEEPPAHCYFILCTTMPEKILTTIKTRCSSFPTAHLNDAQMKELILTVLASKLTGLMGNPEVLNEIAEKVTAFSEGSPRQGLTILEKITNLETKEEMLEAIEGVLTQENGNTMELCRALLKVKKGEWEDISAILRKCEDVKSEPEKVRRMILGYMNSVLLNEDKSGRNTSAKQNACILINCIKENTFYSGSAGLVSGLFKYVSM